jgi:hypothetical protein
VSERHTPWPHAPLHQLSQRGTYFVTAGTHLKLHHFRSRQRLRILHRGLLTVARDFGWNNSHGVYPTYYSTFQFNWNPANTFDNYDVSEVAGNHTGPTLDSSGKSLYMGFDVDISGLVAGTSLWYDLVEVNPSGRVVGFAPFSHADQSTGSSVPDGGTTVLLLGAALSGLGLLRHKLS